MPNAQLPNAQLPNAQLPNTNAGIGETATSSHDDTSSAGGNDNNEAAAASTEDDTAAASAELAAFAESVEVDLVVHLTMTSGTLIEPEVVDETFRPKVGQEVLLLPANENAGGDDAMTEGGGTTTYGGATVGDNDDATESGAVNGTLAVVEAVVDEENGLYNVKLVEEEVVEEGIPMYRLMAVPEEEEVWY